ncbi:C-type lectin domain family 4 member F-like isoform X2 [Biomphalaria glabrata]|uniref:C-type lectin domain family 4 member F-like isoform X2 n=1 Tax=Biomphalaria glabrata TaxID=6526 RepID=A0A9W3AJV8_BIOGL|nr:C-type lectin domain family 4 member F-like isoform X2 [Biomphalaria glabrata]
MRNLIVLILVLCSFRVTISQGTQRLSLLLKCKQSAGFSIYGQGTTKMCLYLGQENKTYVEAQADCTSRNSRLAIFNTLEKFQIVEPMPNVWIGLDDIATEGTYRWADGSILDLQSELKKKIFYPGEPDAYYVDSDCVCQRCWSSSEKLVDTVSYWKLRRTKCLLRC